MTYRGYMFRNTATGVEATIIEEGWDCDWEWIVTARDIETAKRIIDDLRRWAKD